MNKTLWSGVKILQLLSIIPLLAGIIIGLFFHGKYAVFGAITSIALMMFFRSLGNKGYLLKEYNVSWAKDALVVGLVSGILQVCFYWYTRPPHYDFSFLSFFHVMFVLSVFFSNLFILLLSFGVVELFRVLNKK